MPQFLSSERSVNKKPPRFSLQILSSCFQWASSLFSFQLDSYEVKLKFHVLSFASEAKDIVDIRDSEISGSAENVIWNLMEFDYHSRMFLIHSHSFI